MQPIHLVRWSLVVGAAALCLSFTVHSGAHPGHDDSRSGLQRASSSAEPVVGATPVDVLPPVPIPIYTHALARCMWQAESHDTHSGGVFAQCAAESAPVTAGVWLSSYNDPSHDHLVNLSPGLGELNGVAIDGDVDGEGLSDSHPWAHGEPPPDMTSFESLASSPNISGAGIHYATDTWSGMHDNDIRTLCCESLDNDPGLNELENCRYETELVLVEPETEPDLAGQYVAKLACSSGRVTSGGCYSQFLHDADYGLTASHPYVNGDGFEHPDGPHSTTPGETGWACRLDREPEIDFGGGYDEAIAVTVLCCY